MRNEDGDNTRWRSAPSDSPNIEPALSAGLTEAIEYLGEGEVRRASMIFHGASIRFFIPDGFLKLNMASHKLSLARVEYI